MAMIKRIELLKVSNIGYQVLKGLHLSSVICLNARWREENKLTRNPNSFGPLANLPDYSFTNGRPVPFGSNQKKRIDKQREYLVRIKKLVGEIDHAVERHAEIQRSIEEDKQKRIDHKLKEKGKLLLTCDIAE